jgi:hypothetical protein
VDISKNAIIAKSFVRIEVLNFELI